MGFRSVNAAEQHLRALEKKGAIDISAGASRGIRVRDGRPAGRAGRLLELPVIGRVAAGSPILAEEHRAGPLPGRPEPLHAARRLPAARARHVDARRRHPRRRPARRAPHAGSAHRPDRGRAPRRRGHRQALAPRAATSVAALCREPRLRRRSRSICAATRWPSRASRSASSATAKVCSLHKTPGYFRLSHRMAQAPACADESLHHRERQRQPARASRPGGRGRDPRSRRPAAGPRRPRRPALPPDADRASAPTFVAGAIATFELQGRWLQELVLIWWAIVVLFTAGAPACSLRLPPRPDKVASAPQWLRWLAIAALGNGASWGLAGGVFFRSLSDEQQVFLAFLLRRHGVGRHPGVRRLLADLRALRRGHPRPVLLRAAHLRQPPVRRDRAAGAAVLRHQRGDRLPADAGVPFRLPPAPRLRQADARTTASLNQRLERQLVELEEARRQVEASGRKLALFAERAPIAVLELQPDGTRHAGRTMPPRSCSATPPPSWSAAA